MSLGTSLHLLLLPATIHDISQAWSSIQQDGNPNPYLVLVLRSALIVPSSSMLYSSVSVWASESFRNTCLGTVTFRFGDVGTQLSVAGSRLKRVHGYYRGVVSSPLHSMKTVEVPRFNVQHCRVQQEIVLVWEISNQMWDVPLLGKIVVLDLEARVFRAIGAGLGCI
jgi:hypothetical protein